MISDARGGHVSPGIYTEEKNVTYSVQSLGITSLGLAGETLYGPAFEPISIENWGEFVDYFGGTSPEKFKGNGLPKYELPYVAKSYLEESKKLSVVRVLGLSGYHAGPVWYLSQSATSASPVVILRSKMSYESGSTNPCTPRSDEAKPLVQNIEVGPYKGIEYGSACEQIGGASAATDNYKFSIKATMVSGEVLTYNVSLRSTDSDYIYKIISNRPDTGTTPIYIEAVYDNAFEGESGGPIVSAETSSAGTFDNFMSMYRPAITPWIVSDVTATSGDTEASATMRKLFRFITISDGNAANYQVKVSIQNIKPEKGTFDVLVRDFNDNDASPLILEKFSNCSLVEGDASYIAFKIGSSDGGYELKSKYIAVEMADGEDLSNSIPAGFLGYPMPQYGKRDILEVVYNTKLNPAIKAKRQYFGLNSSVLDEDILSFKGTEIYESGSLITNGFHMDSILSKYESGDTYVDGVSGYVFTTVSTDKIGGETKIPRLINGEYIDSTIYADINTRKFSVYFYGGFDGWDINRLSRTNTDDYKSTMYGMSSSTFTAYSNLDESFNAPLNLPATAITSDYYAYLAGYRCFANPQDIDINVFATPGINWHDNALLTEEAIDVIEDSEDGRGGDALYVMASPKDFDVDELARDFEDSEIRSSYACTYFPWVMFYDSSNRRYLDLPVTKDVVRNLAATDNNSHPWFAPAGIVRGDVACVKANIKTTLADEDTLYGACINPVKSFAEDGVKVWGQKTAFDEDTPVNRINVRRLMIRIKKLISKAALSLIFEQYDDTLEKQFKSIVEPILAEVKANRGIYDFRVITEVTEETRDQHILPAKILVKPTPALEYISISFVVYPESVQFED